MSRGAHGDLGRVGVDDQVAAGDELVRQFADDRVQGAHELPGRHPGLGQCVGGGPELAHDGCGVQAAPHHVADHHAHPAASQRDEVEPVAAHPGPLPGREVPARRGHPRYVRRGSHEAALEGERDVALLLVEPREHLLGGLAFGDVADGRGDQGAVGGLQRAQADLDRELAAVAAQAVQLQARAHGAGPAVDDVAVPEVGVVPAEPFRDEHLDRSSQQVLPGVSEEGLGLRVDELDRARLVDDHHRVGRRLQQRPETLLGGPALAHVAHRRRDQQALRGLQRAQADLHGELSPVPAQAVEHQARAHRPDLAAGRVAEPVVRVMTAEPLRDEDLDVPAQEFPAGVAEQGLGLRVHQPDHPGVVHDHHRVRCRFQQSPEGLFSRRCHAAPRTRRIPQKQTSDHVAESRASG